jgi:protein SCO1/2
MRAVRVSLCVLVAFASAYAAWLFIPHVLDEKSEDAVRLIGGPYSMMSHNGETVSEKTFSGKPVAMFFGFTYCPDICPTTLARLAALLTEMGPDADKLQVILVSVDPERDTPEVLKSYLSAFNPRFVGLTGTTAQLAAFAKNYRFYYRKVPLEDGGYTVDHSAGVYLFKATGEFQGTLDAHEADEVALEKLRMAIRG